MKNVLAILLITACSQYAVGQQADPLAGKSINTAPHINTSIIAEELNFLVNTQYRELGPMLTKDGKRLYFSRQGFPENTGGADDEDIWYCEFDDATQSWTNAVNMGAPLNNGSPNFITGIGRNGDTLLLGNIYGKKGKMKAGASISIRAGNVWSFPVPVNIAGDYNLSEKVGYDLSSDRTALIIAQEKADSKGGLDLYVAFRDPGAKHPYSATESVSLGDMINSFGDETSPWLAYDNQTLYFSSNGHNGHGKLDVFVSKRLDKTWTNWSPPVNLGPGINSRYDDMSFNYNPTDRYAYFSRGITPSNVDIYRIDMTQLFKEVEGADSEVVTAEIGQTKVVNNVFADNSSDISQGAMNDLNDIVNYLKKNKTMVIQITAHSNQHDDREMSLQLSKRRASHILDFLVKNGIDKSRLSFVGVGHDIIKNAKGEAVSHAPIDSRVEFKLLGY
jgi:outer membrane protein OmpA-like peptidoglycan-associated protein